MEGLNTIRVLHYLPNLGLGGTEKTCQLFFEHTGKDFEVAVAYETSGDLRRLPEFERVARERKKKLYAIDSYRDYCPGVNKRVPDPLDLQRLIDDFKPDILHVYRSGYSEFPEPAFHVSVPHTVETNVFGFLDQNFAIKRTLFMSKWLMEYALSGIAPISRGYVFRSKRFDFVNNPVEEPCTLARMHLDDKAIWVGRCGRPDNGIYNAVNVEAVRLLRMQGYDVRFLVVAPPSNMVADLTRYDIPFKVIEPTVDPLLLSMFYNSIDIYAHARADGETFGVNIAEAMMHGKPVVTHVAVPSFSGIGVFQSQLELVDNGVTGFTRNNDPVDYMNALKILIDDKALRDSMGVRGREKALREYHVGVCVKKLENIYREVVHE